MTAYAAFQNPTEWSFQKWKEEVNWKNWTNVKSRDNNKKAERWSFMKQSHYSVCTASATFRKRMQMWEKILYENIYENTLAYGYAIRCSVTAL